MFKFVAILFVSALPAFAQESGLGTLEIDFMAQGQAIYTFNENINAYKLSAQSYPSATLLNGRGDVAVHRELVEDPGTAVVGIDEAGYSRIQVLERDGKIFLLITAAFSAGSSFLEYNPNNIELETEFVSGSLADFRSGKEVSLQFIEKANAAFDELDANFFVRSLQSELAEKFDGYEISTKVTAKRRLKPIQFVVTKTQIKQLIAPTEMHFTVEMRRSVEL